MLIVPLFQCFFILGSIICGGVYFKEFDCQVAWQLACFCAGVFIMFAGLGVLSSASAKLERLNHPDESKPNEVRV